MGWEAATLRDLAEELAFVALAERGLRIVDEIEQAAIVDVALDRTVDAMGERSVFRPLVEGPGFRRALAGSIDGLRMAEIPSTTLRSLSSRGGPRLAEIAAILDAYVAELASREAGDVAILFQEALASFAGEIRFFGARFYVLPTLGVRGLSGKLLKRLLANGAQVLAPEYVVGLFVPPGLVSAAHHPLIADARATHRRRPAGEGLSAAIQLELGMDDATGMATALAWLHAPDRLPPSEHLEPLEIELFRAASPASEIQEVLRRVLERGLRWDQVEIAATDPITYGCTLDQIATRLEIPVTYAAGLPLERTRPGRVIRTYLRWLRRGLLARPIWESLASGEILPPTVDGRHPGSAGVARRLRRLRIGWSRERFVEAQRWVADALANLDEILSAEGELDDADRTSRRERREREFRSLASLLGELVSSIPEGVGGLSGARPTAWLETPVTVGAVAQGALRFSRLFAPHGLAEEDVLERVRGLLERLVVVANREARLSVTLAEIENHLAIRVPPPGTVGKQPWTSAGGCLHLTDLPHAGRSCRPSTFVVGLDAERTLRTLMEDPVLRDVDRETLSSGRIDRAPGTDGHPPAGLPTSATLLEENRYLVAGAMASLRGEVTLSHAGWDASDGSVLSPSPVLLQALRLRERDPTLGFEQLEEVLGTPVSPVPREGRLLDATDAWVEATARQGLHLDRHVLEAAGFQGLAAGIAGFEARDADQLTSFHGRLRGTEDLDPRVSERAVSATGLEKLASCPLAWLYRYGLRIREVEDPAYDPGRWLEARERGLLLHAVFERFGNAYVGRQGELGDPPSHAALQAIVTEELERYRRLVPPPSPVAFAAEADEIRRSAAVFLGLEVGREEVWEAFELEFGDGSTPAVGIDLPGGGLLRVGGRIDRLERLRDGTLGVVDFKTGAPRDHARLTPDPPFKGGRQIQAVVYTRVAEALRRERVSRFEYRFPTERGQEFPVRYVRNELEIGLPIVDRMLEMVRQGLFLATDDSRDCKWCAYRRVCRVRAGGPHQELNSPPARWSKGHRDLPEYAILRELREGP